MKEKTGRPTSPDSITGVLEEDLERRGILLSAKDANLIVAIVVTDVTDDTTLDDQDLVLVDCTAGNITISLPAAAAKVAKQYRIKKIDSSLHYVIVNPYGTETIDKEEEVIIDFQFNCMDIVSDGDEWHNI